MTETQKSMEMLIKEYEEINKMLDKMNDDLDDLLKEINK